nr:Msx-like [Hymenolepis microstoma]
MDCIVMPNQSPFSIKNILKSSGGKSVDRGPSPDTNRTSENNNFHVASSFPHINSASQFTIPHSDPDNAILFRNLMEETENQKEEIPGVLRARNRNSRVPFTRNQVERLETIFNQTNYLSGREVTEVARELQISESRVKIWFQNRRARKRREFNLREMTTLPLYPGQPNPSDFLQNVRQAQVDRTQEFSQFLPFLPKDWFRDGSL